MVVGGEDQVGYHLICHVAKEKANQRTKYVFLTIRYEMF
jgi:hypothetical protein